MAVVAIAGTFDSKPEEFSYLRDRIHENGCTTLLINTGIFVPDVAVDITNQQIADEIGIDLGKIAERRDRGAGTAAIAQGLEGLLPRLYEAGRFDAVISMGGSGGTSMVAPAMRSLPIGVPKLIVSTVASNAAVYVGDSDLVLLPSVTDVSGLNSVSKMIFDNAAAAISAMAQVAAGRSTENERDRPVVSCTMFGVTTPCVDAAREELTDRGWEVLVFHATGAGGRTMERLISEDHVDAALDLTTTEWCDELFGGILNAGPHRLEAGVQAGIPQVISLGALDMINFGPVSSLPEEMRGRLMYEHNPTTTLIRTTVEENRLLGEKIAEKLNGAVRPVTVMIPQRGFSALDIDGGAFFDPAADGSAIAALEAHIDNPKVVIKKIDAHINDPEFAAACVNELMELVNAKERGN
ncbi:Tm-1-like ATP-binding domain-containing protein [Actinomycetaceae bacterium L2_0104]